MTDWEKRLRQRAAAIKRAETALKQDVAAARLDGRSFRELGRWADINHETARAYCREINGHTKTRAQLDTATGSPPAAD